jgi:lipid A disaccharide synthetase
MPVVDMPVVAEAMRVVQAAQEQAVAEEGRWLSYVEPTFWRWRAVRVEAEEEVIPVLPRD